MSNTIQSRMRTTAQVTRIMAITIIKRRPGELLIGNNSWQIVNTAHTMYSSNCVRRVEKNKTVQTCSDMFKTYVYPYTHARRYYI